MLPFIAAKCQVINKNTGFQQESLRFTGKLHESENKYTLWPSIIEILHYVICIEDFRQSLANSCPQ